MSKQSVSDDILFEVVFRWVGAGLSGRHAMFLFGVLMLLAATVLLAAGRSVVVLMFGRPLQGLSAAVVWTSGLTLLTDIFYQERYGETVGYAQTYVIFGTTSTPLLDGIVYSRGGYLAVSATSLGTVGLSIALTLTMIEPKAKIEWGETAPPTPGVSVAGKTLKLHRLKRPAPRDRISRVPQPSSQL